jgi:hypothetical protein
VDRFFLEENYGLNQADVVQDGKMREGTDEDWDAMIDWSSARSFGAVYLRHFFDLSGSG